LTHLDPQITGIFYPQITQINADFFFGFFFGREVAEWDVLFAIAVVQYSAKITHLWKSVKSVDKLNKGPQIMRNFYPQITQITQIFFWFFLGEIGGGCVGWYRLL